MSNEHTATELNPYLHKRHAMAFSLGTSLGWGSMVVTGTSYLAQAGPMGTTLGLLVGMAFMLVISYNFHYLMNQYPTCGGAYTYVKNAFGYDRAFIVSWFLIITYISILWANATSLPLFFRYFAGDAFRFGKLYTIFGNDVYLGESLLSVSALVLFLFLCTHQEKRLVSAMFVMTAMFFIGIVVCFTACIVMRDRPLSPAYIPDSSAIRQIVKIAVISPWAFIGFENISHAASELKFPVKKSFRVFVWSVVCATFLYIAVSVMSVTAFPPEYSSWVEYIKDIPNLSGIKALPAFYASTCYLGTTGVRILMLSLLCLILTSFIGNTFALSRLFFALAKDSVVPEKYATLDSRGIPRNAYRIILYTSLVIPFIGRTAISWIVDVTTLCAILIYGFVSAAAVRTANTLENNSTARVTGWIGLVAMVGFGVYIILPNLFAAPTLESETFFLFVVWSLAGMIYFRTIIKRDNENRFGNALSVWIVFISFILFIALIWMNNYNMHQTALSIESLHTYYSASGEIDGALEYSSGVLSKLWRKEGNSTLIVAAAFIIALSVLVSNYSSMRKRAHQSEFELGVMKEIANTDPMTGVKSKHAYIEFEKLLNKRIEDGIAENFEIIVFDVNGLKHINDTQGHKAGDAYICCASNIICEMFKHSPVYRIGGDEFVVVLHGYDLEHHDMLIDKFNTMVEENIAKGDVVVSLGHSEYIPGKDTTMRSVFSRADVQMYERKRYLKSLGAKTR